MPIDNLDEFERGIDAEIAAVREQVSITTRKIALDLLAGVIEMTPIDVGHAKGNWQVSVNVTIDMDIERLGAEEALAAGRAAIESAQPYDVIFLQNSLPYILRLEHGYSQQAPAGMVEVTLARMGLST